MRIIFLVCFIGILFNSGTAFGSTIVFDNSVGFYGIDSEGSLGLSILKEELEFEGFDVTDNLHMKVESAKVTDALVGRANILVLVNPTRRFETEEIDLIKDFVENGGKLILVSDTPESARYMNGLSRKFGGEFLEYFLGNNLTLSYGGNKTRLISPIPLDLGVEPEISLQTELDAKVWFSVWERPGEIVKRDNFTVFGGVRYGEGSVAFLGDKDVLLNENIVKGDNLQFVQSIFNWLVYEKPRDTVAYSPGQLEFVDEKGRISVSKLMIKNTGNVNQTLRFKVPSYLTEMISIDGEVLDISPDETMLVRIEMIGTGNYSHVSDFIIVEREYDYYTREDYIPIKVTKGE